MTLKAKLGKSGKVEEYDGGKSWRIELRIVNRVYDHYLVRSREKAEATLLAWVN